MSVYTDYDEARNEVMSDWHEMDTLQRSFAAARLFQADAAMLEHDEQSMYSNFTLDMMHVNRLTWDGQVYFIEVTDEATNTPLACFSVSDETSSYEVIYAVRNATRVVIAAYRLVTDYERFWGVD